MKDSCIFSSCRIQMITNQYGDTYALMKRTLLQELFTVPYRVTLLMTLQIYSDERVYGASPEL